MKEIDFYSLPRGIQDRLLVAFRAEYEPKPILFQPGARPIMSAWLALSSITTSLVAALYLVGLGNIESSLARHPTLSVVVYVLLVAAFAFGLVQALAFYLAIKSLHFLPGVYLLPSNLIDARDHMLGVYPLAELSDVSGTGSRVVVKFGMKSFSFRVHMSNQLRAIQLVQAARERLAGLVDEAARRELDPLEPFLVESPLASTVPFARKVPLWLRFRWVYAAAFGFIGILLFQVRDDMSDARMFASAQTRDDVASYKRYLEHGEDHRETVNSVLLPRAELRLAVVEGSVEAIDAFSREYPETGIQPQVAAARRKALVATFEKARAARTMAALLSFAERYPKHGLEKELSDAKHEIYQRALESYEGKMPKQAKLTAEFVKRLIAFAEKTGARKTPEGVVGPTVEIRFRRVPSRFLKKSDELVQRNPYYIGKPSLPTRYLDVPHLEPHEQRLSEGLIKAFAEGFPADVMVFGPGSPIDGSEKKMPTVTAPTLVVSYRMEPSGANYAYKKPRGVYVGLGFHFKLDFMLPGDDKPLTARHAFRQRIPVKIVTKFNSESPRGSVETAVYEAMLRGAFAEIQKRYLAQWFKP